MRKVLAGRLSLSGEIARHFRISDDYPYFPLTLFCFDGELGLMPIHSTLP